MPERCFAETMPSVAVSRRPSGLPSARTKAPWRRPSELPSITVGSSFGGFFSLMSATSVRLSFPMTDAVNWRPSESITWMSVASFTTWLFVRMNPSALRTKPGPSDWPRNSCGPSGIGRPKYRSKKSSNPSGGRGPPPRPPARGCFVTVVVEMFTTAGFSRSMSGASEPCIGTCASGAPAAGAWAAASRNSASPPAAPAACCGPVAARPSREHAIAAAARANARDLRMVCMSWFMGAPLLGWRCWKIRRDTLTRGPGFYSHDGRSGSTNGCDGSSLCEAADPRPRRAQDPIPDRVTGPHLLHDHPVLLGVRDGDRVHRLRDVRVEGLARDGDPDRADLGDPLVESAEREPHAVHEAAQRVAPLLARAAHRRERPLEIVGRLEQRLRDASLLRLDDAGLLPLRPSTEGLVVLDQRRVRPRQLVDPGGLLLQLPVALVGLGQLRRRLVARDGVERLPLGREAAAIGHLDRRLAPGSGCVPAFIGHAYSTSGGEPKHPPERVKRAVARAVTARASGRPAARAAPRPSSPRGRGSPPPRRGGCRRGASARRERGSRAAAPGRSRPRSASPAGCRAGRAPCAPRGSG